MNKPTRGYARELELSTMFEREHLTLENFEASSFTRVHHQLYPWSEAFSRLMQVGIYQKGPDVSQVGNTWLQNIADMQALRPFSVLDLARMGGIEAFFPAVLPSLSHYGSAMSLPWVIDTRLVYFRRDLLAKAGIREESAFTTSQNFEETLRRLRDSGVSPYPLAMATQGPILYNLAAWIWAAGGDFRNPDGYRMALVEAETRQGMLDYFRLAPYLHPASLLKDALQAEGLFYRGMAAVLVSGQWVSSTFKSYPISIHPEVIHNLGQALPPGGIPYVGGSHLVIWRHSWHEEEALQLIEHLFSLPVMAHLALTGHGFPARIEAFEQPVLRDEPLFGIVAECIRRGRALSPSFRWAMIEMRLNDLMLKLWADLAANPHLDLAGEIEHRTQVLSARLEQTVLANW